VVRSPARYARSRPRRAGRGDEDGNLWTNGRRSHWIIRPTWGYGIADLPEGVVVDLGQPGVGGVVGVALGLEHRSIASLDDLDDSVADDAMVVDRIA